MRHAAIALSLLTCVAAPAQAKVVFLDCERTNQTVAVGIDTDKLFIQLMWSEGVAEEFQNGDLYTSGPDSFGRKEKVTLIFNLDKDRNQFRGGPHMRRGRIEGKMRRQAFAQHARPGDRRVEI